MEANIQVVLRFRPLLSFEDQECWLVNQKTGSISSMVSQRLALKVQSKMKKKIGEQNLNQINHKFEHIANINTTSEQIYNKFCFSIVNQCLNGINGTICAYGRTCSGKTFSINGTQQKSGILQHGLRHIFHSVSKSDLLFEISIAYLQIYNEAIVDLLQLNSGNLKIYEDQKWGTQVKATRISVTNLNQALAVLSKGQSRRSYSMKKNHDHSSRSHTIFRIYVESRNDTFTKSKAVHYHSVLNIVDLAGSQRLSKTQQNNPQTGNINKSLFNLSNVISKLVESQSHIPYRDSKLTRLLQNSLSGNSSTLILCCLSPSISSFQQSVSTLRFADLVKKVKTFKKQNQQLGQISELQLQIKRLKQKYFQLQTKHKQLLKAYNSLQIQLNLYKQNQLSTINFSKIKKSERKQIKQKQVILLIDDYETEVIKLSNKFVLKQAQWQNIINNFKEKKLLLYSKFVTQLGYGQDIKISQVNVTSEIKQPDQHLQNEFYLFQINNKLSKLKNINSFTQQYAIVQNFYLNLKHDFMFIQQNKTHKYEGYLWGSNKDCRLGIQKESSTSPHKINLKIQNISLGAHHTLAISEGQVFGWGKNNYYQSGSIQTQQQKQLISFPKRIHLNRKIIQVAAGWGHSLCLDIDGQIYSWGYGQEGQLGHKDINVIKSPKAIQYANSIKSIYAGHSHSAFITSEGDFCTFGCNIDFRLMHDGPGNQITIAFKKVKIASLGVNHTCIITQSQKVYGGGDGSYGQLGIMDQKTFKSFPKSKRFDDDKSTSCCVSKQIQFFDRKQPIKISCGEHFTLILTSSGKVYVIGRGSYYRLGTGMLNNEFEPVLLGQLQNIIDISAGSRHSLAINNSGQLYSWGFNMYNQLGTSNINDIKIPTLVKQFKNLRGLKIKAGAFHSSLLFLQQ